MQFLKEAAGIVRQYYSYLLIPAGLFIVSINTGAYMAEIVRGGILSIDRGQLEGAYSVGMTHTQAMTRVVLPQALRAGYAELLTACGLRDEGDSEWIVVLPGEDEKRKNSVMTFYRIRDKNVEKLKKKSEILYSKE